MSRRQMLENHMVVKIKQLDVWKLHGPNICEIDREYAGENVGENYGENNGEHTVNAR